jgi:UDP-glucuronate decarboxylase
VYGDPTQSPQREEYFGNVNPIGIRACYDEGKWAAETLIFDYQRQFDLTVKVVRIFNTYGPGMQLNDGRVITNFIVQALNNKPITIYGNGTQTRSFCYVDDLINGIEKMMTSPKQISGPINLGNPQEISMNSLVETILTLTNSESKISYLPIPSDDPQRRCPDISKARANLSWEPKIDLLIGLEKTINEIKSRM